MVAKKFTFFPEPVNTNDEDIDITPLTLQGMNYHSSSTLPTSCFWTQSREHHESDFQYLLTNSLIQFDMEAVRSMELNSNWTREIVNDCLNQLFFSYRLRMGV